MPQVKPVMDLQNTSETARIDRAISEAEKSHEADAVLLDAKEALASLRRKYSLKNL